MKKKRFIHICLSGAVLFLLVPSCARQDEENTRTRSEGEDVLLSFTVNTPGAAKAAGTRADGEPYQVTGQEGENEVNTITLILVGVNNGAEIRPGDVVSTTIDVEAAKKNDRTHTCEVKMKGTLSMKQHIYIGANLSESQIASFKAGNPIVSTATEARGILDEVMDFNADGSAHNMAMFTAVENASSASPDQYLFQLTGKDDLGSDITLERLVGKVLLTFAVAGDGNIVFTDRFSTKGDAFSGYKGWCSLEDIEYVLTPAGRRVSLARTDADYISDFLDKDLVARDGRYQYFGTPFEAGASPVHPLAYDPARTGASSGNHYYEGIYGIESLCVNDIEDPATFGRYVVMDDIARGVVPSLNIRFRYVPNVIHADAGDPAAVTAYASRAAAEAAVTTDQGLLYYVNDLVQHAGYYTQAAYEAALEAVDEYGEPVYTKAEFSPYKDGLCYYRTFINAPGKDADGVQTYEDSFGKTIGLERNTYHLVSVPTVTLPGDAELRDYIRVNSLVLDWTDRGWTNVNVIP